MFFFTLLTARRKKTAKFFSHLFGSLSKNQIINKIRNNYHILNDSQKKTTLMTLTSLSIIDFSRFKDYNFTQTHGHRPSINVVFIVQIQCH